MSTLLCLLVLGFSAQESDAQVKAVVRMERPHLHFYQIEMIFPAADSSQREIQMAAWTPGSYKIRDFARNIEQFQALDLEGRPLAWTKLDKSTWAINVPSGRHFRITYQVFAYEFTVRTSYLDNFFGFINPASIFFYERDATKRPYEIQIIPEEGWAAASALRKVGTYRFLAADFDELVDSPFQFGKFRRHDFEVRGIPHHWLIAGDVHLDEMNMVDALKKIGETVGDLYGGFPFQSYYIFSQFRLDGAGGGLEHLNSTMVQSGANRFHEKKGWDRFLGLIIHEYFHAWNVKAIHDKALHEFDYQRENYTELLWLHEGWTSYYGTLLMGRAGFWNEKEMRKGFARQIQRYLEKPAVSRQSLTEASFNAWIHQYQPNQTQANSRVSYYSEGALTGLALDLLIRHRTRNANSLDDVMRGLYRNYALLGEPIDWSIVATAVEGMIGTVGRDFMETYVRNANPLPMADFLAYAGLEMDYVDIDDENPEREAKKEDLPFSVNPAVSMGITISERDDAVFVKSVIRDRAGWRAGLDFGDEILALNQRRVTTKNYKKLLQWSRPGDEVTVLVSRAGKVFGVPVVLEPRAKKLKLVPIEEPNPLQRNIYQVMFNAAAATSGNP